MAAALEDTPVSYEELAEIEREFDDVETEIIRHQVSLTRPLYARRNKTISQIPNFWALVLEQAPPDIDQYIQPSDSALLLSSLTSLRVSHFELEGPESVTGGDPRSVSITFAFSPNEYFEDEVLVKKFWYRKSIGGWCGLVSEPVKIYWKKGKDLTGGLLDLVCDAWDAEQKTKASRAKDAKKSLTSQQKALEKKIANTSMGGLSFFAWFGFIGRRVSEDESKEANARESAKRDARKSGKKVAEPDDDEDQEEGDDEDLGMSLEIFPEGDDLAIALTEDLWPGAIKYFTAAQEQDALSDADFESDDEEDDDELNDAERPVKKQRSS